MYEIGDPPRKGSIRSSHELSFGRETSLGCRLFTNVGQVLHRRQEDDVHHGFISHPCQPALPPFRRR